MSSERLNFGSNTYDLPSGVQYFDIDNFSESIVIETGRKAMSAADQLLLLIEASEEVKLSGISNMLNDVAKIKKPYLIVYNGSHTMLDKMTQRFKHTLKVDLTKAECQLVINEFFSI